VRLNIATRARQLRKAGTDAENQLWYALRNRALGGHKFVRQAAIGSFVADFCCREAGLVVELDGGQHEGASDAARTAWLNGQGYGVLRFWNNDVTQNRDGVLEAIASVLAGAPLEDLRFWPGGAAGGRGVRGMAAARAAQAARRGGD